VHDGTKCFLQLPIGFSAIRLHQQDVADTVLRIELADGSFVFLRDRSFISFAF